MVTMPLKTHDEFIKDFNGIGVNFDGRFGNQCVDLFRYYIHQVLDCPQPPGVSGAYQLADNYDRSRFKWIDNIENDVNNFPVKGDIVIWKPTPANGNYGHVAICIDADGHTFTSFDQNFPSQGYKDSKGNFIGTGVCHKQKHNYSDVKGWLHPIASNGTQQPEGNNMSDMFEGINLDDKESVKVAVRTWKDVVNGKYISIENHNQTIDLLTKQFQIERTNAEREAYERGLKEGKAFVPPTTTPSVPAQPQPQTPTTITPPNQYSIATVNMDLYEETELIVEIQENNRTLKRHFRKK